MKQFFYIIITSLFAQITFAQTLTKNVILETFEADLSIVTQGNFDNDTLTDWLLYAPGMLLWCEGSADFTWSDRIGINAEVGDNVSAIYNADMNEDGFSDIILVSLISSYYRISWLENPGEISGFWVTHEVSFDISDYVGAIDCDDDGDLDFVAENSSGALRWFENESGLFETSNTIPDGYSSIYASTVADYNQDGLTDWVGSMYDCCMVYFENTGGGFTASTIVTGEFDWSPVNSGDMDGDGYTDIVYDAWGYTYIALFDAVAGDFDSPINIGAEDFNYSISFADIDGDADADFLFTEDYNTNARIAWIENTGDPVTAIDDWEIIADDIPNDYYGQIKFADFNGDGNSEFFNVYNDDLTIYPNEHPSGLFGDAIHPNSTVSKMETVIPADADGDGDADIFTGNSSGDFAWFDHADDETYIDVYFLPGSPGSGTITASAEADFENDGDIDIISSIDFTSGEQSTVVYLNNGTGSYTKEEVTTEAYKRFWLFDADDDGDNDLFAMQSNAPNRLHYFENDASADQLFVDADDLCTGITNWTTFVPVDFDLDGDLDIAGYITGTDVIQVIENNNDGTFEEPVNLFAVSCTTVADLFAGDFNADGTAADIAYTCSETGDMFYRNNLSGVYSDAIGTGIFSTEDVTQQFYTEVKDITNDGIPDIIKSSDLAGTYVKVGLASGGLSGAFTLFSPDYGRFSNIDDDDSIDFVGCNAFEVYLYNNVVIKQTVAYLTAQTTNYLSEPDRTDVISVSLVNIPASEMQIDVIPGESIDAGAGAGVPLTLYFEPDATALVPQIVTLSIPDDDVTEDLIYNSVTFSNSNATWGGEAGTLHEVYSYTITDDEAAFYITFPLDTLYEGSGVPLSIHSNYYNTLPFAFHAYPSDAIDLGNGPGEIYPIAYDEDGEALNNYEVIVTLPDDFYAEETSAANIAFEIVSIDPGLADMAPADINIVLVDNETASLSAYVPLTEFTEGTEPFTIDVSITSAPQDDVVILAIPDEELDLGYGAGEPATYIFSASDVVPANISVTGTAVEDYITEDVNIGHINFIVTSADAMYDGYILAEQLIYIADNPFSQSLSVIYPEPVTYVEGDFLNMSFSLASVPSSEVTITADPDDQLDLGNGAGNPAELLLEASDLALSEHFLSISAVDDGITEGAHQGSIQFTISTDDEFLDDVILDDAIVNIEDKAVSVYTVNDAMFLVYPTVSSGYFILQTNEISAGSTCCIFNLQGEKVFEITNISSGKTQLNLHNLPQGMYQLVLQDGKTLYTAEIEITR